MINNPSEFRRALLEQFAQSPLTIGGAQIAPAVVETAIEEVIGGIVMAYMREGEPTACEKIVGAFFVSLLERQRS